MDLPGINKPIFNSTIEAIETFFRTPGDIYWFFSYPTVEEIVDLKGINRINNNPNERIIAFMGIKGEGEAYISQPNIDRGGRGIFEVPDGCYHLTVAYRR